MKEITVLSGKGGTGKTTITAALASVANNVVLCDNDVDAADLHILLDPKIIEEHVFSSGYTASIDQDKCLDCGLCKKYCRFDAIAYDKANKMQINPIKCEGCRLCERICPANAITSKQSLNNHWYVSNTRFGSLVHAEMGPGEENSGKLVSQVRKRSKEIAIELKADFILNDGPPGIGCSAISALSGTDLVLLIIEPSMSGLHDAKRLVELIRSFNIKSYAIINKHDINLELTKTIESYLLIEEIPLLEKIPFEKKMVESMVQRKTIVEFDSTLDVSKQIISIWEQLIG